MWLLYIGDLIHHFYQFTFITNIVLVVSSIYYFSTNRTHQCLKLMTIVIILDVLFVVIPSPAYIYTLALTDIDNQNWSSSRKHQIEQIITYKINHED